MAFANGESDADRGQSAVIVNRRSLNPFYAHSNSDLEEFSIASVPFLSSCFVFADGLQKLLRLRIILEVFTNGLKNLVQHLVGYQLEQDNSTRASRLAERLRGFDMQYKGCIFI